MSNAAVKMFQELWGQEMYGHPRFFELLVKIAKLHSSKDHDYTAGKVPYSNVRESTEVGVVPWRGVLVRMTDKWSRIRTFAQNVEYQVLDEKFVDTLLDLAVYSLIALILYEEESHANKEAVPAQTGNLFESGDRSHSTDKLSEELNSAFQTGYKEKDTGPSDKAVQEVHGSELARDDGSSIGIRKSPS